MQKAKIGTATWRGERIMKREKRKCKTTKTEIASALKKKRVIITFEDETSITQKKPCIRKSMSFEGDGQQRIEHILCGSRKKFSLCIYISMVWPLEVVMYDFYDVMNSYNTI